MVFIVSIIISDDETQQPRAQELSCPSPLLLQWGADASLSRLEARRDSSSLLVLGDCQGQDSRAGEALAKAPLGFWAWGCSVDAPLLLAPLPRALHNSQPMSFGWTDGTLPTMLQLHLLPLCTGCRCDEPRFPRGASPSACSQRDGRKCLLLCDP